jgi:hypothetical protein
VTEARTTAHFLVSALIRRASAAGGSAMVLAKGDATSGAILLVCLDRGVHHALLERMPDGAGSVSWQRVGPESREPQAIADYLVRRRRIDPDLWLVELDIAGVEQFTAEMTGVG